MCVCVCVWGGGRVGGVNSLFSEGDREKSESNSQTTWRFSYRRL